MKTTQSRSLLQQFTTVVAIACALVILSTAFGALSLLQHNESILVLSEKKSQTQETLESIDQALYEHLTLSIQNDTPKTASLSAIDQQFSTQVNKARDQLSPTLTPHLQAIKAAWHAMRDHENSAQTDQQTSVVYASQLIRKQLKILNDTALAEIERELNKQYSEDKWIIVQVVAGALIGLALSVWLVMRLILRISDNLHKLGQGIAIAAVGDLGQRISIDGCSEIEALSEGFNYMTSELDRQNHEVLDSEKSLFAVMNSAPDAIITTDLCGIVISWNNAAETIFAYSLTDMCGQALQSVFDPNQQADFQRLISEYENRPWNDTLQPEGPQEFSVRRKDGLHVPIEITIRGMIHDDQKSLVVVGRDITERKAAEEKMAFFTQHDSLTHLPNRSLIRELLIQSMNRADSTEKLVGVITLGINNFTDINDNLGHTLGDGLLVALTDRINDSLSRRDHFGRIGGDEFCIIIDAMRNVDETATLCKNITNKLSQAFHLGGHEVFITASMGIAIYPFDDESPEVLLKHASAAMYRCKRGQGWQYLYYADEMNSINHGRVKLTAELQHALEEKQFIIHYQPQYNISTNQLVGVEALIRWQHPTTGLLAPNEFISLLEDSGLIIPVGQWVLSEVFDKIVDWNTGRLTPLRFSINLSARQFKESSFINDVSDQVNQLKQDLFRKNIIPSLSSDIHDYLEFELTEGVLMENSDDSRRMLFVLKELGIKLSVDDFGTGYSSLSYLQQFPLDALKIDQSFVREIGLSQGAELIVHAIIDLAHNLRLHVIGEGVETQQQLRFLRDKGCDEAQGYLFEPAMSSEQFEQLLENPVKIFADIP